MDKILMFLQHSLFYTHVGKSEMRILPRGEGRAIEAELAVIIFSSMIPTA